MGRKKDHGEGIVGNVRIKRNWVLLKRLTVSFTV